MKGIVVKSTGSWYSVRMESGEVLDCRIKGKFRMKGIKTTNPVAVGDVVEVEVNPDGAVINRIEDRKNYIIRKSTNLSKEAHIIAANVDQAVLVVTVNHPVTSTVFIDRFLASVEAYRIPGVSTMYPPKLNGNISANVVVCFPVSWESEISATFSFNPGSTRLISEDFPTPDKPENTVTLSFKAVTTSSIPSPVNEDT